MLHIPQKLHDELIGKGFVNLNLSQLLIIGFKAREMVHHLIFTTLPILKLKIKILGEKYPSNKPSFLLFFHHEISKS